VTAGLVIAAPASGSGKTTITLGLLRHFRNRGVAVAAAKIGPDYIDPAFHAAAGGRACVNLDAWAMRPGTVAALAAQVGAQADLVVAEGVMGLFDGAPDGSGSTADVAAALGWPVVLVVDVRGQATSAAATVLGFARFRPDVTIAGVIFNRTGGDRHAAMLRRACAPLGIPVLGCLPRREDLAVPDRHLGLVQAAEHEDIDAFCDRAAAAVAAHIDTAALAALAAPARPAVPAAAATPAAPGPVLPPPGQRIAVAADVAFAFTYGFVLDGWRAAGAEIALFSPLADQAPGADADAVYLPGGYPELHAGRLAGNAAFLDGVRRAAGRGAVVYGECGGYMTLGRGLVDAAGIRHEMLGLLPVETSFARRRLHLGYRLAETATDGPFGAAGTAFRGHEFHFASILAEAHGDAPLFHARDASGTDLGAVGARCGSVMGSFMHLIDRADAG
jgi:cobyrinic acid a,c-diamide synthase